jgi:hypothetical protein
VLVMTSCLDRSSNGRLRCEPSASANHPASSSDHPIHSDRAVFRGHRDGDVTFAGFILNGIRVRASKSNRENVTREGPRQHRTLRAR